MRLNHIRDFIAIVDAGSFRAAARALALSQPALTKSIRQLESELGLLHDDRPIRNREGETTQIRPRTRAENAQAVLDTESRAM